MSKSTAHTVRKRFLEQSEAVSSIGRVSRDGQLPLSFAQQRLWFLDQLVPNNSFYNIPGALRLRGQLSRDALQQSLDELVVRHEILRTSFVEKDETIIQIIAEPRSVEMPLVDLSHYTVEAREGEANKSAAEEALIPFDLSQWPLFRAQLLCLDQQDHVLLLTMHHIVSDGWSIGVFNRELTELYKAFCLGQPSPLPELPIQYSDFAVWQRAWLQGDIVHKQLAYWSQRLANASVLQLPTDRPRPAVQRFEGSSRETILSNVLYNQLVAFSQSERVTLFMTMLSAFATLLQRYTNQDDIIVGSPIANRGRAEIDKLIGFFVNSLVIRTDVSGNPTFRELVGRVRETALDAYDHQDLPFEQLVEELEPERDLSRNPLFQVMFAVHNSPADSLRLGELEVSTLPREKQTTHFDLETHIWPVDDGLHVVVNYSTSSLTAPRSIAC